jgi:hypothetical protein
MQALKIETQVTARGTLRLPPLKVKKGTPVEVIVLVRESEDESADLMRTAETTLDFWDNPVDDEVWNDA